MYQLTAVYAHPVDPEAFLAHYREKHVPIVRALSGVRFLGWTVCEDSNGSQPPHFVVAVVHWDDREQAMTALASPMGQAAVADLANFAGAGVDISLGEVQVEF